MTELSNVKITSNATKKPKNAEDCVTKKMNNKKTKKAVEETVQKMLVINVENTVAELKPKALKLSQTKKAVKKLKNTLKSAVGKTTMSNPSNAKPPLSVENTKIQLPKNMMTAVIKEVEEKMAIKSKRLSESLPRIENNKKHPKKAPGVNNLISAANEMTVDLKTKPRNLLKSANTKVYVVKENQTHKKSVESKRTNPADIESVNVQTQTYLFIICTYTNYIFQNRNNYKTFYIIFLGIGKRPNVR